MFQLVGHKPAAQTRAAVVNPTERRNAAARAANARGPRGMRGAAGAPLLPPQRRALNPRLPPIGSRRPPNTVAAHATTTPAPLRKSKKTPYEQYQQFARSAPMSDPRTAARHPAPPRPGGHALRAPPPTSRVRGGNAAVKSPDKYTVKIGVRKKPTPKPTKPLPPIQPPPPAPGAAVAADRPRISLRPGAADRGSLSSAQAGFVLPVLARFLHKTKHWAKDATMPPNGVTPAMAHVQRKRNWSLCRVGFFSKALPKRRSIQVQEEDEGTYVGLTELAARVALPNQEEHDALLANARSAYRRAHFKYTMVDSRMSCLSVGARPSSVGKSTPMPVYRPPSVEPAPATDGPRRRGAVIEECSDDDSRPSTAALATSSFVETKNTEWNLQHLELPSQPSEAGDWGFSQGTMGPDLETVLEDLNPYESTPMDFLGKMCILPDWKLNVYRTVFDTLIKGHDTNTLTPVHLCHGLRAICGHELKDNEIDFVAEMLELAGPDRSNGVTFEEFAMAAALAEHIPALEEHVRGKINPAVLGKKKRKAMLMFFVDAAPDCTLHLDDLESLLDAGRVAEEQKRAIIDRLSQHGESVTFMEYLTYLPLFLDLHDDIVTNTFHDEKRNFDVGTL